MSLSNSILSVKIKINKWVGMVSGAVSVYIVGLFFLNLILFRWKNCAEITAKTVENENQHFHF